MFDNPPVGCGRQSAFLPGSHVQPARDLFGPFIQSQPPDGILLRRHFFRLVDLALEIVNVDGNAKARIGLHPDFWIGPVVALVDGGDIAKPVLLQCKEAPAKGQLCGKNIETALPGTGSD